MSKAIGFRATRAAHALNVLWTPPGGWSLVTNVGLLAGGTALGQMLAVLCAPVLTRLYLPEDLGRLGLYLAFIGFASVASSLRYELAIVAARTRAEAAYLTLVSITAVLPTSILLSLGLYALISSGVLGFDALPVASCWIVLCSLVASGALTVLRFWFVRQEAFKVLSSVAVRQNAVRAVSQVVLGAVGLGWPGLLVGDVLGRLYAARYIARMCWDSLRRDVLPLDAERVRHVLRAYRDFPLYSLPSSLLDTLAVSLLVPLVSAFYTREAGGHIALVSLVLALPVSLVGSSVADVFHARMAVYARDERPRAVRFFLGTSGLLFLIGALPSLALVAYGRIVFELVFGANWSTAGLLASVLAPSALATLVVNPVSRVIVIFHAQPLKLAYDVMALAGVIGSLAIGARLGLDVVQSITLVSVVQVLACVFYWFLMLRVVLGTREG